MFEYSGYIVLSTPTRDNVGLVDHRSACTGRKAELTYFFKRGDMFRAKVKTKEGKLVYKGQLQILSAKEGVVVAKDTYTCGFVDIRNWGLKGYIVEIESSRRLFNVKEIDRAEIAYQRELRLEKENIDKKSRYLENTKNKLGKMNKKDLINLLMKIAPGTYIEHQYNDEDLVEQLGGDDF